MAFPDGIPRAIRRNEADHRDPYPGDDGIRFLPKVSDAVLDIDLLEKLFPGERERTKPPPAVPESDPPDTRTDRQKSLDSEVPVLIKLDTPEKHAVSAEFWKRIDRGDDDAWDWFEENWPTGDEDLL